MKSIMFFSLVILISAAGAQETATPDNKTPTSQQVMPRSAVEFFEVIHPDNKRNPNWPEKLTIEPITSISQKEFEKTIRGRWRLVYHCGGSPIPANRYLYDGINEGYLELTFNKENWKREVINKSTEAKIEHPENDVAPYVFRPLGKGIFLEEQNELSEKQRYYGLVQRRLVKIDETDEYGLETLNSNIPLTCPDGKKPASLYLPIKKEVS